MWNLSYLKNRSENSEFGHYKKQFYTVPKEYFTQGGDSSDPGLMIENHAGDTGSVTLVQPTIYYETDDFYYIDDETVSAGDVVVKTILPGRIPSAVMWTSSPVFIISTKDMLYLNKLIFLHKTINIPSLIQALPTESPCMIILL